MSEEKKPLTVYGDVTREADEEETPRVREPFVRLPAVPPRPHFNESEDKADLIREKKKP